MTCSEISARKEMCVNRNWLFIKYSSRRMGSESIAHETGGRMGYLLREAMRARGIIVLVKSNWLVKNIETKQL